MRLLSASGLPPEHPVPPLLHFLDALLRGIGQVMLQNNSYSGLLFLTGLACSAPMLALGALLGCAASTATAQLLGCPRAQLRAGLYGFNGALVAIALLVFLQPGLLASLYVLLAAACSSVLMAALLQWLKRWKLPALTAAFVLVSLAFILASARFGRLPVTANLPSAGLPKAALVEGVVSASTLGEGLLTGIAQVFFQGSAITGALFLLGLLLSSRRAAAIAVLGALAGLLVGWALGAAEPALRAGAYGFNPVLTALALSGAGLAQRSAGLCYVALATIATTVAYAALSSALAPIGMPALTAPFVLVTWGFLLAAPLFQRLPPPAA